MHSGGILVSFFGFAWEDLAKTFALRGALCLVWPLGVLWWVLEVGFDKILVAFSCHFGHHSRIFKLVAWTFFFDDFHRLVAVLALCVAWFGFGRC